MLVTLLVSLSIAWPHLWGAPPANGPAAVRPDLGGWHLRVRRDRFTGEVSCRLADRGATYERGAVVFHLAPTVDTSAAVYRIDWGAPFHASDDAPELAHMGFALHLDELDNPSGGLVRVPVRKLVGARLVSIEPRPNGGNVRYKINGLSAALSVADHTGCRFVTAG